MPGSRRRCLGALSLALAMGLGLGACQLPNPDHCFNLSDDPNAWCASTYTDEALMFCSPCAETNQGCVADEPASEDCPLYTTPAPSTETSAALSCARPRPQRASYGMQVR